VVGGFWLEVSSGASSRWRRWLIRRGGIVRVVFELRTRWTPNVGSQSLKALISNTGVGEMRRLRRTRERGEAKGVKARE
jgi:hypothetical protein